MLSDTCLFCKIIRGEISATKVYEDDAVVVFHDIAPQAPVHLLAIPKTHVATVHEVSHERAPIFADLMSAVSHAVISEGLAFDGYRLVINSGAEAGQAVPHLHVHILGGRTFSWPPG